MPTCINEICERKRIYFDFIALPQPKRKFLHGIQSSEKYKGDYVKVTILLALDFLLEEFEKKGAGENQRIFAEIKNYKCELEMIVTCIFRTVSFSQPTFDWYNSE